MNRFLKIYAIFAVGLMLSACGKDGTAPDESGQLISFTPAISSTATKGSENIVGIIQNTVFPTDRTFAMNMFRLEFDSSGNPVMTGGHIFMNMEQIVYNSTDGAWHAGGHHYWPLSGGLYYLGFCPAPDTLKAIKMLEGMTADFYGTLQFTGIDIKHTDASNNAITNDALKTDANLSHAQIDLMNSIDRVDDVQKRTSNTVPVNFTHVLSQLRFTVEAAQDYSSYTEYEKIGDTTWYWTHWQQYWLDEIKLTNIKSKGTYSLSAPHWPSVSDLYTYYPWRKSDRSGTQVMYKNSAESNPQDSLKYKERFGTRIPVKTQVSADGINPLCILLIPQSVSDDATVEIKLNSRTANLLMADKDTQSHIMNDINVTITKSFRLKSFLPLLVPQTCTTINFKISQEAIEVGVSYGEWDTGSVTELVM